MDLGVLDRVDCYEISKKVINQIYDGIPTSKLDELASQVSISMITIDLQYGELAGRITVSNHQKNTDDNYCNVIDKLSLNKDLNNNNCPLLADETAKIFYKYESQINNAIDYKRDYLIDYFGFKTLERAYLMKTSNNTIIERPQHMWMRVSIGIHGDNIDQIIQTYHDMSTKLYTHATPTLFNAGTPRPQMSSCFLLSMKDDSISGIYDTLKDCALISKWGGGIGLHIHNVRASGSYIRGTGG